MSLVIDAKTGKTVALDVAQHVESTLDLAYAQFGLRHQDSAAGRLDAAPAEYTERYLLNAAADKGVLTRKDAESRIDSFFLQRELTAIGREVETQYERPKLLEAVPVDTTVAPGAKFFTASRISEFGEPAVWIDGMKVPQVELAREEEVKQVIHLIIGASFSLTDMMAAQFSGKPLESLKVRAMQRSIQIKLNRMVAFGHAPTNTYGLLTHPYIPKLTSAVDFDGSESVQTEVNEISRMIHYAKANNKDAFESLDALVSARVHDRWANTQLTGTGLTLLQFVKQNNPQIRRWVPCWEFQGVGPSGTDALMFTRLEEDSISYVQPQGFTLIPGAADGLSQKMYGLASYGGVQAHMAANSNIHWVNSGE